MAKIGSKPSVAERVIEQLIFSSRWLLAPVYVGLAGGLLVIVLKFIERTVRLMQDMFTIDTEAVIVGVLAQIDLALIGSLVVMVMFAGYENFVSRLDVGSLSEKPRWMGHVDFTDLKLKLMASIVAISAIHVLGSFMNAKQLTDRDLTWDVIIHTTFVLSALLLALMDKLVGKDRESGPETPNPE